MDFDISTATGDNSSNIVPQPFLSKRGGLKYGFVTNIACESRADIFVKNGRIEVRRLPKLGDRCEVHLPGKALVALAHVQDQIVTAILKVEIIVR